MEQWLPGLPAGAGLRGKFPLVLHFRSAGGAGGLFERQPGYLASSPDSSTNENDNRLPAICTMEKPFSILPGY